MIDIVQADLDNPLHASAVVELLDLYAQDPMGGGEPLSVYTQQHLIEQLKDRGDVVIVLAFEQQQAVGLINCFEGFSTFLCKPLLNIHDVTVHPQYRGKGIASKMLALVERIAKQRDCCKLTLEVLQGNAVAQSAYKKAGFKGYQLDPEMGQALFWEKKL